MSRIRPRVIWSGVDSLDLFSRAAVPPAQLDHLRSLRLSALKKQHAEVQYGGEVFDVAPRRGRNAALILRGRNMTITVRPDARGLRPRVTVELRAVFLACVGADAAVARARAAVSQLAGPSAAPLPLHVSRIDLATDVQGWNVRPAHLRRFHSRARRIRDYDGPSGFTGFTFGKGARLARIYDKTAEIARSGKSWVIGAWAASAQYRDGAPVWRIEFQLRREALQARSRSRDRTPLDTWEQVRSGIGTLWRELTSDWLSIRLPRTARTRRRYAPEWRAIMEMPFQGEVWPGAQEPLRRIVPHALARSNDAVLDREITRAVALRRWAGDGRALPEVARAVADDALLRFVASGRRGRAAVSRHVARFRGGSRGGAVALVSTSGGGTHGDGERGWVEQSGIRERVAHGRGSDGVPAAPEPGRPVPGGQPWAASEASDGAPASLPQVRAGCAPEGSVAPHGTGTVHSWSACVVGGGP